MSRYELAATLCENLPWKAPNGKLKLDACWLFLESLASAGMIDLPPKRGLQKGAFAPKTEPLPCALLEGPLRQFRPVTVDPVEHEEISLWNATMAAYHPLGYRQPFGAYRRYWIRSLAKGKSLFLGAMLFSAAAKTVSVREAFIGWTKFELKRFRYRIVNNSRFLILPGVNIPHLASHVLSLAARRLRPDWLETYGYAPVLAETFVTPPHRGTCYLAANWTYIGETAGLSRKKAMGRKPCVPVKMMFVYPLVKNWRAELLAPAPDLPGDDEEDVDLDAQS